MYPTFHSLLKEAEGEWSVEEAGCIIIISIIIIITNNNNNSCILPEFIDNRQNKYKKTTMKPINDIVIL